MTDRLKIALDYDLTYTRDPEFWENFIKLSENFGHEVLVITYRDDRYDKCELLDKLAIDTPVYYTRGVAKKWWSDFHGPGKIDIWIDDRPESILENSQHSVESLAKWRSDR